jgi:hypothetical protein
METTRFRDRLRRVAPINPTKRQPFCNTSAELKIKKYKLGSNTVSLVTVRDSSPTYVCSQFRSLETVAVALRISGSGLFKKL